MDETPFENAICFICDFGHWILLGLLTLGAAAYLTRDYWRPAALAPTPTAIPSATVPAPTVTVEALTSTPSPTPELYGYSNTSGGYAFNYPSGWSGIETGPNVRFDLPSGGNVQVSVSNAPDGVSLTELIEAPGPIPSPPVNRTTVALGGAPAIRQEVLGEDGAQVTGLIYFALRSGRLYTLALYAPAESAVPGNFARTINDFDQLAESFFFLESIAP